MTVHSINVKSCMENPTIKKQILIHRFTIKKTVYINTAKIKLHQEKHNIYCIYRSIQKDITRQCLHIFTKRIKRSWRSLKTNGANFQIYLIINSRADRQSSGTTNKDNMVDRQPNWQYYGIIMVNLTINSLTYKSTLNLTINPKSYPEP